MYLPQNTNVIFLGMDNEKETDEKPDEGSKALRIAIGNRVKKLREEATEPLSQYELAEVLSKRGIKVKQAQIGHIESGTRLPSVPLLLGIAEYYQTSVDFLMGRTKNQSSISDIDEDLQTGGISGRLGELYKRLPQWRQEEVYKFAHAQTLIEEASDDASGAETERFVRRMLNAFEKRIGKRGVESALDELALEFPSLASSFVDGTQPTKKQRGQS